MILIIGDEGTGLRNSACALIDGLKGEFAAWPMAAGLNDSETGDAIDWWRVVPPAKLVAVSRSAGAGLERDRLESQINLANGILVLERGGSVGHWILGIAAGRGIPVCYVTDAGCALSPCMIMGATCCGSLDQAVPWIESRLADA